MKPVLAEYSVSSATLRLCVWINQKKTSARPLTFFRTPVQQRVEEALNVAIKHSLKIAHIVTGADVLDSLVRMQKVVANL